ncbi:MAG: hypothetical protein V4634_08135 [Pseudomonadota bacterium]
MFIRSVDANSHKAQDPFAAKPSSSKSKRPLAAHVGDGGVVIGEAQAEAAKRFKKDVGEILPPDIGSQEPL